MTAPEVDATTPVVPVLRIVRGDPNAEELAALVAVLAAAGSGAAPDAGAAADASQWGAPTRMQRGAIYPGGPSSWWASGLPR